MRQGRRAHIAGDPLVIHDPDVLPLRKVVQQQVHTRVVEPVDVPRVTQVLEGQYDPFAHALLQRITPLPEPKQ